MSGLNKENGSLERQSSFERRPRSHVSGGFRQSSFQRTSRYKESGLQEEDGVESGVERSSFERAPRSERYSTKEGHHPSKSQIKRATRTRLIWSLLTSLLLLISVVFIILVELGDTQIESIVNKIYFIRLDLSDIIPVRVPNATIINSIARSLGLHDFYTVGLWGFCEGYNGEGVTFCSDPELLYWFNPIEILQSELLAGATIALPAEVNDILRLIRIASNWMFGCFLAGGCLSFVMIFIVPLSVYSRWAAFPIAVLTFGAALVTTVAAAIATAMFIVMQRAITQATQLNIGASIGIQMFIFMWIAAGAAILALIIQLSLCCCCASRRDVKTGKKRGSLKAWDKEHPSPAAEKEFQKEPGRFSAT